MEICANLWRVSGLNGDTRAYIGGLGFTVHGVWFRPEVS